jgi:hypothetical protein
MKMVTGVVRESASAGKYCSSQWSRSIRVVMVLHSCRSNGCLILGTGLEFQSPGTSVGYRIFDPVKIHKDRYRMNNMLLRSCHYQHVLSPKGESCRASDQYEVKGLRRHCTNSLIPQGKSGDRTSFCQDQGALWSSNLDWISKPAEMFENQCSI